MKGADLLRAVGRIAGIVLIVACFSFRADFTKGDVETRDEWSVGVWFSPWLVGSAVERRDKTELGTSSDRTSSVHVTATSWSWVVLAAGAWLVFKCRRRERAPEPQQTPPPA